MRPASSRCFLGAHPYTQGTLTPLLGIGVCVSIQFGALEYSKRLFAARNVQNGRGGPDGSVLTSGQLFVSGSIAGIANGVVSGPVEHIRIRECLFRPPHLRLLGARAVVLRPQAWRRW